MKMLGQQDKGFNGKGIFYSDVCDRFSEGFSANDATEPGFSFVGDLGNEIGAARDAGSSVVWHVGPECIFGLNMPWDGWE